MASIYQMSDWLAAEPVIIEQGEGFYLIDTEGRRYIDGPFALVQCPRSSGWGN